MAMLLIMLFGLVAIDSKNLSLSGMIASGILYLAVVLTIFKGLIMIWSEKRHERKRKNKFIQEEVLTEGGSCLESPGSV
ncbi:hypothetical protein QRX25_05835 [Bacillus sp. L381]|uniref:hypothetical protein n=1 Tax=Bacillus TaxID=1386 RepID=UPI00215D25B6|nr:MULTISPECIES: hypothetical protein [Bacillus]WIX22785.1 hypothetical protein QRX25_05835 [Bacillus sp. L381]